jgi:hypothetical protein
MKALPLTNLRFCVHKMPRIPLVACPHNRAIASPTVCPTTTPWFQLSTYPILEGALYAAGKSFGWKTVDVSCHEEPIVLISFGIIAECAWYRPTSPTGDIPNTPRRCSPRNLLLLSRQRRCLAYTDTCVPKMAKRCVCITTSPGPDDSGLPHTIRERDARHLARVAYLHI